MINSINSINHYFFKATVISHHDPKGSGSPQHKKKEAATWPESEESVFSHLELININKIQRSKVLWEELLFIN